MDLQGASLQCGHPLYYPGVQQCDRHEHSEASHGRRPHLAHLPLIRVELAITERTGLAKTSPKIGTVIGRAIGI